MDPKKPHSLRELHHYLKHSPKSTGAVEYLRKGHYGQIETMLSDFFSSAEPIDYTYQGLQGRKSFLLHPLGYEGIVVRISTELEDEKRRAYHEDILQPVFARTVENKKGEKILVEILVYPVDAHIGKKEKIALDLPDTERIAPDLSHREEVSYDFLKPNAVRAWKRLINLTAQQKHQDQGMGEHFSLGQGAMRIDLAPSGKVVFSAYMLDGDELKINDPERYAATFQKTGLHKLAEKQGVLSPTFSHLAKYLSESARNKCNRHC